MMKLAYNPSSDRYELDNRDMHCGTCFAVRLPDGSWKETRIEYGMIGDDGTEGWYLVGTPYYGYFSGVEARW